MPSTQEQALTYHDPERDCTTAKGSISWGNDPPPQPFVIIRVEDSFIAKAFPISGTTSRGGEQ